MVTYSQIVPKRVPNGPKMVESVWKMCHLLANEPCKSAGKHILNYLFQPRSVVRNDFETVIWGDRT